MLKVGAYSMIAFLQWFRRLVSIAPAFSAAAMFFVATGVPTPSAYAEFDPNDREWSGLAKLVALGRDISITVVSTDHLRMRDVEPGDSILFVHPRNAIPPSGISEFLRTGGRVALLDDNGRGDEMLAAFGIERATAPAGDVVRLRENAEWPVAFPRSTHPLASDVSALVANGARVVRHPALEPIFAFNETEPFVLAGAVGEGRLVVAGDASLLINDMLALPSHVAFARNLLRYLAEGRSGRVWLASENFEVSGRYGDSGGLADVDAFDEWLKRVSKASLSPRTMRWATLVLLFVLALAAYTAFPQRSPYETPIQARPPLFAGGFEGRVDFFRDRDVNLVQPALVYKASFERELLERTGLAHGVPLDAMLLSLRERGVPETTRTEVRSLLEGLHRLSEESDDPARAPRTHARELASFVRRGEAILALLSPSKSA
jgi:hypothetical protein